ncbi:MAG: hypothetical protein B7X90_16415 [Novosphingobium sp. 17-62-19]|nr:MAG: hypothetical protein B7Y74_00310 [Novosphingobium sp. 35-62-5]OZA17008.1 MAG: hypothetical protein B7X90_16415 [Novosphingobium sp. 17-62-19]
MMALGSVVSASCGLVASGAAGATLRGVASPGAAVCASASAGAGTARAVCVADAAVGAETSGAAGTASPSEGCSTVGATGFAVTKATRSGAPFCGAGTSSICAVLAMAAATAAGFAGGNAVVAAVVGEMVCVTGGAGAGCSDATGASLSGAAKMAANSAMSGWGAISVGEGAVSSSPSGSASASPLLAGKGRPVAAFSRIGCGRLACGWAATTFAASGKVLPPSGKSALAASGTAA